MRKLFHRFLQYEEHDKLLSMRCKSFPLGSKSEPSIFTEPKHSTTILENALEIHKRAVTFFFMPTQVILSSGTTAAEIAGAIKLLVAVRLAKKTYAVSYDVSVVPRGLAPALMSEDHRVLIAVNAAVRFASSHPV